MYSTQIIYRIFLEYILLYLSFSETIKMLKRGSYKKILSKDQMWHLLMLNSLFSYEEAQQESHLQSGNDAKTAVSQAA